MRSFTVRFADGLELVIEGFDETDAKATARELHPDVDIVDVFAAEATA